jgi:hypothetical protein
MEPMFDDQYQAMRAAEEAAKQARRASLEAERAAGRGPSTEPPGDSPNQQLSECAPPPLFRSPDFSRHSRHCSVCSHPDRDAIEAEFIRWRSPEKIAKDYDIPGRSCLYRHAHATGLFPARKRHVSRVIESFLETIDDCPPDDFDPVTRAVRAYAHLDDDGNWFEPDRTLRILTGPFAVATSLTAPIPVAATSPAFPSSPAESPALTSEPHENGVSNS